MQDDVWASREWLLTGQSSRPVKPVQAAAPATHPHLDSVRAMIPPSSSSPLCSLHQTNAGDGGETCFRFAPAKYKKAYKYVVQPCRATLRCKAHLVRRWMPFFPFFPLHSLVGREIFLMTQITVDSLHFRRLAASHFPPAKMMRGGKAAGRSSLRSTIPTTCTEYSPKECCTDQYLPGLAAYRRAPGTRGKPPAGGFTWRPPGHAAL